MYQGEACGGSGFSNCIWVVKVVKRIATTPRDGVLLPAGEPILRQGSPVHSIYFVQAGFVDLIIDGSVADTVYTGEMFGEVALLCVPPLQDLVQVWLP